jgi:MFS family permease
VGGVNNLADLWLPLIDNSVVESMGVNAYGSYTLTPGSKLDFNASDSSWSSELHMAHGGSTHNVYIDWYHYAGKTALIVLVLFLGALLVPLLLFVWSRRKSLYWPLVVAVSLQVVVIVAAMYAQPYWWLRYYWVVFGLAAGLMIHPELASLPQTNPAPNRVRR